MRAFVLPSLVVLLGGCLDYVPYDPDTGKTFIALQKDFQNFKSWEAYVVGSDAVAGTGGHPKGQRTVYINKLPPPGSAHFPVGTMIVKVRDEGPGLEPENHAMVKRGGDFNAKGAVGWEWFDIDFVDGDPEATVIWRGLTPPVGHGYRTMGGETATNATTGDCNSCHAAASDNDFVMDSHLVLKDL